MSTTAQILYCDLSKTVFTETGIDSPTPNDHPPSNLNDYNPQNFWQSQYLDHPILNIDLHVTGSISAIAIDGHNLDSCAPGVAILLQGSSDNISFTTIVGDLTSPSNVVTYVQFAPVTYRYWKIWFIGTCADFPQIGNLFLGTPMVFPRSYDWGFHADNPEFQTTEKVSLRGTIINSQVNLSRLVHEFGFKFLSDSFRLQFFTFLSTIRGRAFPFYFVDITGIIRYMLLQTDYNPVDVMRVDLNTIQTMVLKTQFTKQDWYNIFINMIGPFADMSSYNSV